jgi:hypothetical protein
MTLQQCSGTEKTAMGKLGERDVRVVSTAREGAGF